MIIPDSELINWATHGGVQPCDVDLVNPASIDLRWSGRIRIANSGGWDEMITVDKVKLTSGGFYLLDTLEFITVPLNWAGMLTLKSSLGRMGLEHSHAGFFDPGFRGTATLEIHVLSPWPIELVKNQPLVQLVMLELKARPSKSYFETGHYNGQSEPTPAK